ncbi:hypothetical protein [Actinopolyspora mortivallis]|uniref:hypothetical protein n=1 Tax=Actinopolyspora mortivallis TaxID=33906 RepID=UPI00036622E8|nr:hypothetical protein [Actinopolyspora mortivallis]
MRTWTLSLTRNLVARAEHERRHRLERSGGVGAAPEFHVFTECRVVADHAIQVRQRHRNEHDEKDEWRHHT